jgi:hypothetical protein
VGADTAVDLISVPDVEADFAPFPDVNPDRGPDVEECQTLGCPCEEDSDCRSGYCIEGEGGRICSEFCTDDCTEPGYDCVLLENSGGDAVRLCVPESDPFCDECRFDTDCGTLRAACLELDDGQFCLTPCEAGDRCRGGTSCLLVEDSAGDERELCVPDDSVCTPCIDDDGDLYGLGIECLGRDPDDNDPTVYPGAPERCDGLDNDGNLEVDEDWDFQTDSENCGGCGITCELENASAACVGGLCTVDACDEGWDDCNALAADGCETDLSEPLFCGACVPLGGVPGEPCGVCESGAWTCEGLGEIACVGDIGEAGLNACGGCSDLATSIGESCGECGTGMWTCDGLDAAICAGVGEGSTNACGGCSSLDGSPGDRCGACSSGLLACDGDASLLCEGDLGVAAPPSCVSLGAIRFGSIIGTGENDVRRATINGTQPGSIGTSDSWSVQPFPTPSAP